MSLADFNQHGVLEQPAATLAEVRAAMKIDYFDDKELIAEQARQYQQQR